MPPTPLHRLAETLRDELHTRLSAAPAPAEETALEVGSRARLSVNMKPSVLKAILQGERFLNAFERAEQRKSATEQTGDEALGEKLKGWHARRLAFEEAMGGERHFYYHSLNIGGLGAPKYGRLCAIDQRAPSETPPQPVWIAWDSLAHGGFWRNKNELNEEALAKWVAPCELSGTLAALKLNELTPDPRKLAERICSDVDTIEGLCLEGISGEHIEEIRGEHIEEIRGDEASSDDRLQQRARQALLGTANEAEALDLADTQQTKDLAHELGIPWTIVRS